MTQERKLRELINSVRITGTLKEMNLVIKPNKKDPTVKQIQGNIIVSSVIENRVNEHRVELFAKDTSKLFKGYKTVMDEYNSIDKVGIAAATRLTVSGSIDGNDYLSNGQLQERNRVKGLFINRVEDETTPDEAVASIELVVTNIRPLTKDGIETGEYGIDAFTIGYGSSVIALKDLVVGANLANVITSNYQQGSTGKLTFQINNYNELVEKPKDPFADDGGFGIQVDIGNEVKNYTRNLQVIGGFPPYFDERAFEEEDIILARKIRALALQEIMNAVPNTPPQQGGFGANAPTGRPKDPFQDDGRPIDISEDDLPF